MDDEWRPVPGYADYAVSRLGFVARQQTGEILPTHLTSGYYPAVSLHDDLTGRCRTRIHHIVAWVFHGPKPFHRAHVRHIDGNPNNNRWDNLCWGSAKENGADRVLHGTTNPGETNCAAVLTSAQVTDMKRRVAGGEHPMDVAEDCGLKDRYLYGLISGRKWEHHQCEYDAAARAAVRSPLQAREIAEAFLLKQEGHNNAEIGRRLGRSRAGIRRLLLRGKADIDVAIAKPSELPQVTVVAAVDYEPPKELGSGQWVRIPDRDYLICEDGSVWDCRSQVAVKPRTVQAGYVEVVLKDPMDEPVTYRLHRLMAMVFFGPPTGGAYLVRHKDSNPANNHIDNLAWGVERDNAADRMAAGTTTRGERSSAAKFSDADVRKFRAAVADGRMTMMGVARAKGVSPAAASMMLAGKTWQHIPMPERVGARRRLSTAQGELPF